LSFGNQWSLPDSTEVARLMLMSWWQQLPQLLLMLWMLLLLSAAAPATALSSKRSTGVIADADVFRSNLQYISKQFFPKGWKLNAVMKVLALRSSYSRQLSS
jgi:hypothetical protein